MHCRRSLQVVGFFFGLEKPEDELEKWDGDSGRRREEETEMEQALGGGGTENTVWKHRE